MQGLARRQSGRPNDEDYEPVTRLACTRIHMPARCSTRMTKRRTTKFAPAAFMRMDWSIVTLVAILGAATFVVLARGT